MHRDERAAAERYVRRDVHRVDGWFQAVDARLFVLVDAAQRAAGIAGDLVEIGVFEGRSALLLGHLRRSDEHVIACDLFGAPSDERDEDRAQLYEGGADLTAFLGRWAARHDRPPVVVEGPSSLLEDRLADSSARFVHVDGSHEHAAVVADLALARRALVPGGIVAVDDWRTAHSPGVGAAVWRAVFESGLRPLLLTDAKLYGSWQPDEIERALRDAVRGCDELTVQSHTLAGVEVLQVLAARSLRVRALARLPWAARRRVRRLWRSARGR